MSWRVCASSQAPARAHRRRAAWSLRPARSSSLAGSPGASRASTTCTCWTWPPGAGASPRSPARGPAPARRPRSACTARAQQPLHPPRVLGFDPFKDPFWAIACACFWCRWLGLLHLREPGLQPGSTPGHNTLMRSDPWTDGYHGILAAFYMFTVMSILCLHVTSPGDMRIRGAFGPVCIQTATGCPTRP